MTVWLKALHNNGGNLEFRKSTRVVIKNASVFVVQVKDGEYTIIVENSGEHEVFVYKNKLRKEIPLRRKERLSIESADRIRVRGEKNRSALFLVWTSEQSLKFMSCSFQKILRDVDTVLR